MEQNGNVWNTLEATVSYRARARLTPTLTHVVTYELVTSGAEDKAMSIPVPSVTRHSVEHSRYLVQYIRLSLSSLRRQVESPVQ